MKKTFNLNKYLLLLRIISDRKKKRYFAIALVIILQAIAGIFENLSVISLIPLLSLFIKSTVDKTEGVNDFFINSLNFIGLEPSVLSLLLITTSLIILKVSFSFLSSVFITFMVEKVKLKKRIGIIKKISESRWEFCDRLSSSKVSSSINLEIPRIGEAFRHLLITLGNISFIIFYFVTASILSLKITFLILVLGTIKLSITKFFSSIISKLGKKLTLINNNLNLKVVENIQNLKILKSMEKENDLQKGLLKEVFNIRDNFFWITLVNSFHKSLDEFITFLIFASLVLYLSDSLYSEIFVTGVIFVIFSRLIGRISKIQSDILIMNKNINAFENYNNIISDFKDTKILNGKMKFMFSKSIKLENVKIGFGKKIILKSININFFPGQSYVIFGRSGIGKSTLGELIMGLRIQKDGKILFDGLNQSTYNLILWRKEIGFSPQTPYFFYGTIKENLTFFDPNVNFKRIENALEISDSLSFVNELPKKLNTILQEGGKNLSSGQLQRLSIARAIIFGKKMLILDEATSNLNTESEKKVLKNILKQKNITKIFISHNNLFKKYIKNQIKLA